MYKDTGSVVETVDVPTIAGGFGADSNVFFSNYHRRNRSLGDWGLYSHFGDQCNIRTRVRRLGCRVCRPFCGGWEELELLLVNSVFLLGSFLFAPLDLD